MATVFHIGATIIGPDFNDFLEFVGASETVDVAKEVDADLLVEVSGRLCYQAWKPYDGTEKTNPNVMKIREGNDTYIKNIIKSGHGSVFEHVQFTFALMGVSRVLTHELVRHRAGMAYSQASLRYIRLQEFDLILPDEEGITSHARQLMLEGRDYLRGLIAALNRELIETSENKTFTHKKKMTSWIRRIAPIGISTNIIFTANARAMRHIIMQRTSRHAEIEIREAFGQVATACAHNAPNLFIDMQSNACGEYTFPWYKVECNDCGHVELDITPDDFCIQCESKVVEITLSEQRGKM